MNPAHILYLVYTGAGIFRGLARTRMDEASWRAAADTLYAEGVGLCFEWTRSDSFKNFCETVKSHIGGEVYPNRQTGQISIRLLRDDLQRCGPAAVRRRQRPSGNHPGEDQFDIACAEPIDRQVH
ncbi:bacteriophage protein [Pseudomonas aeruginosa]|nr:bacteriophage protein [Pseudomonas aeruginosa]